MASSDITYLARIKVILAISLSNNCIIHVVGAETNCSLTNKKLITRRHQVKCSAAVVAKSILASFILVLL